VWVEEGAELHWVDIPAGALHRREVTLSPPDPPDAGAARGPHELRVPHLLGAALPRADRPGWVVAVDAGFGTLAPDGALTVTHPVLSGADVRMNDAACDARGRVWAGSCAMSFEPGRGGLHRLDEHGARVLRTGMTLPNGIAWSPDDRWMYVVDSEERVIWRHPYDLDTGDPGPPVPWVRTGARPGVPDGVAVDRDGCLWVAMWGGAAVDRYDADGDLVGSVAVPVSQPSSCAFLPDGTLAVTTARAGLSPSQLAREPWAGGVLGLATTTHGVAVAAAAV
jgi:sugar lactone lactonase YvrE